MIDRPDWNGSRDLVAREPQSLAEIRSGQTVSGETLARLSQQDGDASAGLPAGLARDLANGHGGFEENLALLQQAAVGVLEQVGDPQGFAAHFDTLSASIQEKAFRVLWRNPGIGLLDLLDKVEPTLTLAEAHEAERWVRALRR